MVITLSVVMCLQNQCSTKWVMDSERAPEMTLMGCLTQGAPSIARFVAENYPGAKIVKWQCVYGTEKPVDKPDL